MHVLFVSSARFDTSPYGDGSTRYRCFNVGEALEASGHTFSVTSINTLSDEHLHRAEVISVLRPRYSKRLARFVTEARNRGIHTVVDFDDLIFNPAKAYESPLVVNGFSDEAKVSTTFQTHAKAAALFDEVTVSTSALHEEAKSALPALDAHVLRNGLSELWLNHGDRLLQQNAGQETHGHAIQRLTYLPGTVGHDKDFCRVQEVVRHWLAEDSSRRFYIVGKLNLDNSWSGISQLERCPLVDYFSLPHWINQSTLTIAPLVDNTFNSAKSHIKYLESAAFGVPAVCSPNSDLENHQNACGLHLASSQAQWEEALKVSSQVRLDTERKNEIKADVRTRCHASTYSASAIQRWESIANSRTIRPRQRASGAGVE